MAPITIIKQDHRGEEITRYQGEVLERDARRIVLEARFGSHEAEVAGLKMREGDRFVETYFIDRWYNVYEIHDREDDHLKGWYCNVCYPAEFDGENLSYRDLALDLLVFPDGSQKVLDEEEFAALPLSQETRQKARAGLREIRSVFKRRFSY